LSVLVSASQKSRDEPMGGIIRKIVTQFDEYQSKENAKHTLRAKRENARQGFCSGSRPPIGYPRAYFTRRGI